MSLDRTDRRGRIKWTLFLLAFDATMAVAMTMLMLFGIVFSGFQGNVMGILFVSTFALGFSWWINSVRKQIARGSEDAWGSAVVIAVISIPSIALPFAVLSLRELLSTTNRREYFRPELEASFAADPAVLPKLKPVWTPGRVVAVTVLVGLSLVAVGSRLTRVIGSLGGFSGEKPTVAQAYRLDPNLSARELWQKGAQCNSQGDHACEITRLQGRQRRGAQMVQSGPLGESESDRCGSIHGATHA